MSFSSKVKSELIGVPLGARHCMLAELGALLLMSAEITCKNNEWNIEFITENEPVARKYFTIVQKAFNINTEVILKTNKNKTRESYRLYIKKSDEVKRILLATTILKETDSGFLQSNIMDQLMTQSICCKRAYLRGAFLGAGSVSYPEKGYHLEFVTPTLEHANYLKDTMHTLEMDPKIVSRKNNYVVYLKEGAQIVDLLNIMGAHIALMELENIRIVKEVRNNVNRLVNCETANLKKTVSAAVRQVQDIEYLQKAMGLSSLPDNLEEIARYRLEYPSATLKELGELLCPPVGKSGVNHRLRKLSEIAEQLREQRGGSVK